MYVFIVGLGGLDKPKVDCWRLHNMTGAMRD